MSIKNRFGFKCIFSWKAALFAAACVFTLESGTAGAAAPDLASLEQQVQKSVDAAMQNSDLGGKAGAMAKLVTMLKDKTAWTEDLMKSVARLGDQFGVAVDELVPSVAGCVKEPDGKPVLGAPVVGLQIFNLTSPTTSLTKVSDGVPFLVEQSQGQFVPVPPQLLSGEQKALGAGCFWMPVKPDLARLLILGMTGGQQDYITIVVQPFAPGYLMEPAAKDIRMKRKRDGSVEVTVTPVRNLFDFSAGSTQGGKDTTIQAQ